MIYVVYRIYGEEPNKGYYWGKWRDPISLGYACYNMCKLGFDAIKIIEHEDDSYIENIIEV